MRWPNDRRLAENVEEIDLILGGHDHDYNVEKVGPEIRPKFKKRVAVSSSEKKGRSVETFLYFKLSF